MRIVELILDEDQEYSGIEAISIVERPAIEEDFIALNNKQEYKLAEVDEKKKILLGALLIPNKPILRTSGDGDYYIYFSKDTVRKASELYLMEGNQNQATLEHQMKLKGLSLVESWIVEDSEKDKSAFYGLSYPVGTWVGAVKVTSDKIWNEFVETGRVKGFSIEGYFQDKSETKKDTLSAIEQEEAEYLLSNIKDVLTGQYVTLESYNDYPDAVSNNAKRGIELNKKVNNKCATDVGKIRAQQLAQGEKVSTDTIKRMYSYLSRAEAFYDPSDPEACGTISYLLWGGKSAKNWAESKINKLNLYTEIINEDYAIIDDRLAYSTKEKAEEIAKNIGCSGHHIHEVEGKSWYMPCEKHETDLKKKYKCPPGYKKDYQKHKCVKATAEEMAEVGPRGGIRRSPKAPGSTKRNTNPKGKGTAKGNARTSRGAKVDKQTEGTLQKKSDEFNERYKKKLGYGVTIGQLKTVFQRGLGAFNVGHSPRVTSAKQWALARVNAYLYLVKNGRPQNAKYKGDNDLLPKGHPKSNKK